MLAELIGNRIKGHIVNTKAELLQLKPHPFICRRNFFNEKVRIRKN